MKKIRAEDDAGMMLCHDLTASCRFPDCTFGRD